MKKLAISVLTASLGALAQPSIGATPAASPQALQQQQLQQQALNLANSLNRQLTDMKFAQGAYKNGASARDYVAAEAAARQTINQLLNMGLMQYDTNLQRAMIYQGQLSQLASSTSAAQQSQAQLIQQQNSAKALQVAKDIMTQSNANLKLQAAKVNQQRAVADSLATSKNKTAYQNALSLWRSYVDQYSAMERAASQATTNYNNILKNQNTVVSVAGYGSANTLYK